MILLELVLAVVLRSVAVITQWARAICMQTTSNEKWKSYFCLNFGIDELAAIIPDSNEMWHETQWSMHPIIGVVIRVQPSP